MPPVRVRLGYVATDDHAFSIIANDHRNVRGERAVGSAGDEDGERVRAHERQCGAVATDSEVFGNVHG